MPGLDRAGLEQLQFHCTRPEGLETLDAAAPAIDPRDLREEPVRAPRDGCLGEHHAGDRRSRRVGLTAQMLLCFVSEVVRTEGSRLHTRGILSSCPTRGPAGRLPGQAAGGEALDPPR